MVAAHNDPDAPLSTSFIPRSKENVMAHHSFRRAALSAALLSLGLGMNAMAASPTAAPATPASTAAGSDAKLAHADRKFIEDAAKGGMAEVELGKLAQQKASNEQVKQFGERMVQDHSKAGDELKQVASSKGVTPPATLDKASQHEMDKLQKLSGAQFDREYMDHMVKDHKKDIKDFQKEAKSGKDADVKNFASSTLPTLQDHLKMAQAAQAAVKGEKVSQR
jgi:putative membrane protein